MSHINQHLTKKTTFGLNVFSFLIPILIWCAVSYLPFIWHPQVEITNAASVTYLQEAVALISRSFIKKHKMLWH